MYSFKDNNIILDNSVDKKYVLSVRDKDDDQNLFDKFLRYGSQSFSSLELMNLFLGEDNNKEIITKKTFKEYGEKSIANQKNPKELARDLNISLEKSCQIIACFELGRRFFDHKEKLNSKIRTAKQAFAYLKDMGSLNKEHFRGLYLDSRYKLIHDEVISVGSLTASIIHPREIFRPALEYSAVAIIVAHNHPSGNLKATKEDFEITKQLLSAGKIMGIDVLDHLIIAKNKFLSIIEN